MKTAQPWSPIDYPQPSRTRYQFPAVTALVTIVVIGIVFGGKISGAINSHAALQTASTVFAGVFIQATPFLVMGVIVSGALAGFVSPALIARITPKNPVAAVAVAGVSGIALPGCECSAVPVTKRLMDRGLPPGAAIAFLLAAPAVNPVVIVSTAVAFPNNLEMAVARPVASMLTALIVGWVWIRTGKATWISRRADSLLGAELPTTRRDKWELFASTARHDLLEAGSFLVIGAAAAAALHVLVPQSWYHHLAGHIVIAIGVMAVLAIVLALCSEADAFVAASMASLPLIPRLVFLVVGPAVDVKLAAMQAGAFGRPFIIRYLPLAFAVSVLAATGVGYVCFGGWK